MNIHPPVSIDDAMTMLDSRVPLTFAERCTVVKGLYRLAFAEGREAGIKSERARMAIVGEEIQRGVDQAVEQIAGEYEDTTARIRRQLEEKDRTIAELMRGTGRNEGDFS